MNMKPENLMTQWDRVVLLLILDGILNDLKGLKLGGLKVDRQKDDI